MARTRSFDPLNNLLATTSSVENNVSFANIEFSNTGWYAVKQGDTEITRFQVIDYPGSVDSIAAHHVIRGWQGPIGPYDFRLQRVVLDSNLSPPCRVDGQTDPPETVYVPPGSLSGVTFLAPFVSHPLYGVGPYLGGRFASFGSPTIVDAGADKVIWRNIIYPAPVETGSTVRWMTWNAFVHLGQMGSGQVTLSTHAETELRSVVDPSSLICLKPTETLSIPVVRQ